MYKDKVIAVVVPAYNEETQIANVIHSMPSYVDYIVIVNDKSTDNTVNVIAECKKTNEKIILIDHAINQGVGGAIASGYKWCAEHDIDAAAVMAGDGQMNPNDLPALLDPVVENRADYSKGNRLVYDDAYNRIPKIRYFGNSILSLLTKIASGYWHVADSQTGYTVINKLALKVIDWDKMYKRYGQPNDLLVKLNIHSFRVVDVPVEPVYNIGEKSGIKVRKVVFSIGWLLVKLFFHRLKNKYIIKDFHPLVFFYALSMLMFITSIGMLVRLFYLWYTTSAFPEITFLTLMFTGFTGLQSSFFAMWFDSQYDRR